MQVTLRVRDLVIASWETDRESLRTALPEGMEPADVEGRALVSIVGFHVAGGRIGRVPLAPFNQLNVRTYVNWREEPAVFFVASRVTTGGLPGRLLRAPYKQARLRVASGSICAPGLGVSLSYSVDGEGEPGELGQHELGLYELDGLRAFRIRRREAAWKQAALTAPPTTDFLLGLGLPLRGEPSLLYAAQTAFEAEVPPARVEAPRADARETG